MKDNWHKHPKIVFKGLNYYRDPRTGYYYHTDYEKKTKRLFHRDKWEVKAGIKIPEGFVVHHIDHNKENNRFDNLQVMARADHQRHHSLEGEWVGSKENLEQLRAAGEKAAEWHRSDEGRAWHSKNSKQAWLKREQHELDCTVCGRKYLTPYPTRSKFCHLNCKATALRRRRKAQKA